MDYKKILNASAISLLLSGSPLYATDISLDDIENSKKEIIALFSSINRQKAERTSGKIIIDSPESQIPNSVELPEKQAAPLTSLEKQIKEVDKKQKELSDLFSLIARQKAERSSGEEIIDSPENQIPNPVDSPEKQTAPLTSQDKQTKELDKKQKAISELLSLIDRQKAGSSSRKRIIDGPESEKSR